MGAILEAGNGNRPWTVEEISGVAWARLVDKYPQETKGIGENEAVEAIQYFATELLGENKLKVVAWSEGWYGEALLKTVV